MGGASSLPDSDAAAQGTLNCAPVDISDYLGVHAERVQPAEETEL